RLDFMLYCGKDIVAYIEVKGVTLVEDGIGLFPDAPTVRGRRHVDELAQLAREGARAAVLFVVQREDGRKVAPNWRTDPAFAEALARACAEGVEARAYGCRISPEEAVLQRELPVDLSYPPGGLGTKGWTRLE
ncbi:MAG: DNA/RNA nuclease SfsA, partial [Christensenellales bacterium]